ncbi:LysE family translocator [Alginatibacterium sediminis]|uniref:LysE family translocator n=1 Tax=Alginatibacterium sediminis TaxID=2164068 RepID=A0A420E9S7_9ALTE|nr:LysE family translocator [Alginatibacterium sediminis]RKF17428.1 LysE family translocator [Alginatibacterium sediminis]
MDYNTAALYTVVSFFYVVSPGPAVFLAMSNGMSSDTKSVVLSSLGNILGLFFLSFVSIIGLGSLILASSLLFLIVKLVGAAYLIFLGFKQFRSSKNISLTNPHGDNSKLRKPFSYFYEGFLLAATNPKPILFFVAIFPQFLNLEAALIPQFFIMTSLFMCISFLVLFSYGNLAKYSKKAFLSQAGLKWFHRLTGGLFVGMGVGLLQLKNAQA